MTIRPPDDAEAFRTQVYGARWYYDPLPTCELAEATTDKWPAVSTVKKAWRSEFRKRHTDGRTYPLDPLRVALYVDTHLDTLAKLPTEERVPLMAESPQRELNKASDRGTGVHHLIEDLCAGKQGMVSVAAPEYVDICHKVVDELAPEILFAEVVAISRRLGVGGTTDAITRIDGKVYAVDWKSRGATASHGCYEVEAAQLGCYASADYLIGDVDGAARRVALPELDGLLIVSIKPDSYEVYPVELEQAKAAGAEMCATWKHKRDGEKAARAAKGKPIILAKPRAVDDERTAWVKDRLGVLASSDKAKALVVSSWPTDIDRKGPWTTAEVDRLAEVLREAENTVGAPFPEPDPAEPPAEHRPEPEPVQHAPQLRPLAPGAVLDESAVTALRESIAALDDHAKTRLRVWSHEADRQCRPFAQAAGMTQRSLACVLAAMACISAFDDDVEALTRHALHLATGEQCQASWLTGAVIGSLTIEEAQLLGSIAVRFASSDTDVVTQLGRMAAAG